MAHLLFWVCRHFCGKEMHICWSARTPPEGLASAGVCFKLQGVVKLFQRPRDGMIRHGKQRLVSGGCGINVYPPIEARHDDTSKANYRHVPSRGTQRTLGRDHQTGGVSHNPCIFQREKTLLQAKFIKKKKKLKSRAQSDNQACWPQSLYASSRIILAGASGPAAEPSPGAEHPGPAPPAAEDTAAPGHPELPNRVGIRATSTSQQLSDHQQRSGSQCYREKFSCKLILCLPGREENWRYLIHLKKQK